MLLEAMLAGLAQPSGGVAPPPVPVVTREEVERAPPSDQDQRLLRSRNKHALQFDDGPGCAVELAHEKGRKVIVDNDGIEIRDERPPPAHSAEANAQTSADIAPVDSCTPK